MVITRTPIRISFVGGGSDLPEYFENSKTPGRVISTTINKYVYIVLNRKFDDKIRVSYSKTEIVDSVDDIQHDIVRNTMKRFNMGTGWEIVSVADIPGDGTGMGSSSAFAVGLIKAISKQMGILLAPEEIAEMAYVIERNDCGSYCGKQDQYAAALGGLKLFEFLASGSVYQHAIFSSKVVEALESHLQLFYIGKRKQKDILARQAANTCEKIEMLSTMSVMAYDLWKEIYEYPCQLGQYLDLNWEYKRQLVDGISNDKIESIYQRAMEAGANGGKVLGQGGGGFILFHSDPKNHSKIKDAVGLKQVPFGFTSKGSEVIHAS